MKAWVYYLSVLSVFVSGILQGEDEKGGKNKNLLQDGFAAVAVSVDHIEAIYMQAIENDYASYVHIGDDWDGEGCGKETMLAGMQVVEEPKILFITDDSYNFSEIAFENVRPANLVKLSRSEVAEINEALIVSHIKARSVDPKPFNVDLDD